MDSFNSLESWFTIV
jgi:GTPase SAR1 family protein